MKTIFILCDTLNRRMLSAYGAGEDAALRRACPHAATS